MNGAPSMRYLGVPAGATARRLLELPDGPLTAEDVDAALRRQRRRIERHPGGREPEAQRLLRDLDDAAKRLLELVALGAPPAESEDGLTAILQQSVDLTPFDREILSTLVASGGWNRESRSRLLTTAARHGVGGKGLAKVLNGMTAAMRTGAVSVRSPAATTSAEFGRWRDLEPSRLTAAFEQLEYALAREVRGDTPARLMRLVGLFVGIAIIAGYCLVRALAPAVTPVAPPPQPTVSAAEAARAAAPPTAAASPIERAGAVRPARWSRPPDLHGLPPSEESRTALRELVAAPEVLAKLARRLQLAANRPSGADINDWETTQALYAKAWPLLDPSSRAAGIEASVSALRPIQEDEVAKRFLSVWIVDLDKVEAPLAVWRGGWSAGMLAEIAARPTSSDSVAALAIDQLDSVVPRRALIKGRGTTIFDAAAGAWLDKASGAMSILPSGDAQLFADRWERWFDAQHAVRSGAALQAGFLHAIGDVLASGMALSDEGPPADLLGRLVASVDWTERSPDQQRARDAMTVWFTDRTYAASRLWVLTSMLDLNFDAAWYVPEFVVDPSADVAVRGQILERILAAWPAPRGLSATGGGIVVDSRMLERWRSLLEKVGALAPTDDPGRLRVAVLFARLNTVAQAFAVGDDENAQANLAEVERELAVPGDLQASGVMAPGRLSGSDGEFAAAYENVGRDASKRQDELRALRSRPAAGDLGPRDAEVLVNEALRGSPSDVRSLAQTVLIERFGDGPGVLQELLDQLPNSGRTEIIGALIEKLTNERLPDARSPDFERMARLALVRTLLSFEPSERHAVDGWMQQLAGAFVERSRLFRIGFEEPPPGVAPEVMAARLAGQWRLKAGGIFLADPFPATLEELDRRRAVRARLCDGPVQRCAAEQIGILELMAAIVVADRPTARTRAQELLAEAGDRRARAGNVLEQVMEGERALTKLIDLTLESGGGTLPTPEDVPTKEPAT